MIIKNHYAISVNVRLWEIDVDHARVIRELRDLIDLGYSPHGIRVWHLSRGLVIRMATA